MKKDVLIKSMLAAGILVAASTAFAKFPIFDSGHSSKQSANVAIIEVARIPGGPTLQPGEYKVALNNSSRTPEIGFYQDGKLVAQVPANLVEQAKKFEETAITYEPGGAHTHVITEMDLRGWREEVLFGQSNGAAGSTK